MIGFSPLGEVNSMLDVKELRKLTARMFDLEHQAKSHAPDLSQVAIDEFLNQIKEVQNACSDGVVTASRESPMSEVDKAIAQAIDAAWAFRRIQLSPKDVQALIIALFSKAQGDLHILTAYLEKCRKHMTGKVNPVEKIEPTKYF